MIDELCTGSRRLARRDLSGELVSAALALGDASPARLQAALARLEISARAGQELERRWEAARKGLQQLIPLVPSVDLGAYLRGLIRLRPLGLLLG